MQSLADKKVLGTLPEKDLGILKSNLENINRMKFQVGDLEVQKHKYLKEIEDLRYELKTQEQKIIKRYGEKAVIDVNTGEVYEKQ